MSATSEPSRSGKRRGLIFKLGVVLGVLVALLVVAYFVVTSGVFIKGVILPRVGNAMNADVTARDVSLSPWSELVLQGFKLQPRGKETLFEAEQIHARYSLWDIIRGKIVVQEAGVTAPVVTIVQNADGTSNLDPLTKKGETKPSTPSLPSTETKKPSAPPQVDIKQVYLKNAQVNVIQTQKDGSKMTARISDFDFTIDQIQNGQPSNLKYSGNVAVDSSKPAPAASGTAQIKLTGGFALKFSPALAPESVTGNTRLDVLKASGAMSNLVALATIVDCDLSMSEIRKANVRVEQGGVSLAEVRASGPFSIANNEGHLKVELGPIDRRALNIVGGPLNIDFNKTAISSVNEIDIKQKAKVIAVNGKFLVNDFSAKLTNGVTPTLNIQSAYAINLDLNNNNGLIQQLNVDGTQNQTPFLKVSLSKPMPISWGAGSGVPDEASLDMVVTNFNLADWAGFAGALAPAGRVDTTLHLLSRKGGRQLTIDLATGLNDFGARFGSNQISGAGIQLGLSAVLDDFKLLTLNSYKLDVSQNGNTAMTASGSGTVNLQSKDTDMKASFEARIPQLLQVAKIPGMAFKSGSVRFDGKVAQNTNGPTVNGTLALTDLSGTMNNMVLDRLQAKFDTDIAGKGDDVQIRKMAGTFEQGGLPGGAIDVKGGLNSKTKVGQIVLQVTDINQNLLKPFAAPSLSGKQLESISINANLTTTLSGSNSVAVLGGLAVSNLVVRATNQTLFLDHFQANLDTDLAVNGDDVQIRKMTGILQQAGLPGGTIDVKGGLNSKTKVGKIVLQVGDINQNLLKPLAAPSLPGKQLVSISINANVTTTLGASNSVAIVGGLGITNLVVKATNATASPAPLSAQFKIDAGMQSQKFDIRQLQIALSPTDRAKNQVDCKGQVDMAISNAINAALTVQADSIDVTPFYDQLTGGAKPAAAPAQAAQPSQPAQPAQPATAQPAPKTEPPAMSLPVGLATVNVNIGKFYLRQVEITNWQAAIRVETNRITVNPFQLSLNGAPVNLGVDANVGIPGYRYQLTLGIDKAPIEPLANTFMPDKQGMYKGMILANVSLNGAGITDPSLRSNLNGQISFSLTNAMIQISTGTLSTLIQPIATVLKVSDVLSDPLNSVSSVISIGQGKITVQTLKLLSPAFSADVHGDIQMANVLTNSPVNLPVTFALSQSLAKRVPYLSTLSDTNSAYVNIPDFVKLGGTLGKPTTTANLSAKSALGAAEAIGKKFGGTKANETINALGGLFGNKPAAPATTNAPGTNAPSTNAAPSQVPGAVNQLIDIFKKK